MIPLTELLSRFKNITNTEKSKKEIICREIKNTIGIDIDVEKIKISRNTILLKVEPIIKTEILLKKQELIKRIKSIRETSYFSEVM